MVENKKVQKKTTSARKTASKKSSNENAINYTKRNKERIVKLGKALKIIAGLGTLGLSALAIRGLIEQAPGLAILIPYIPLIPIMIAKNGVDKVKELIQNKK